MTTKAKDVALSQEEVVIERPRTEASAELRGMVDKKLKNLTRMWTERKASYNAQVEAGGYLPTGYVYWDCLLLGPYQKSSLQYGQPSKIIAGDEEALMVGLIWVNPNPAPNNLLPGSLTLGTHAYKAVFEAANISTWEKYDSHVVSDNFPNVAPEFTELYWTFTPPDPGQTPHLYEVHFAVDLDVPSHPFATFATWHRDPENDGFTPGWMPAIPGWTPQKPPSDYNIPSTPVTWPVYPHYDHDIPARFLVYRL